MSADWERSLSLSLTGIVISQLIKGSAQLWIVVGLSFLQETNTLLWSFPAASAKSLLPRSGEPGMPVVGGTTLLLLGVQYVMQAT